MHASLLSFNIVPPAASGRSVAPMVKATGNNTDDGPISYSLGAPVLTDTVNVYPIFYGAWSDAQRSIVTDFFSGISSTAWMNVTRKYYSQADANSAKIYCSGAVQVATILLDSEYTIGKNITGTGIPDYIQAQIEAGKLPEDPNGLYYFMNSADVQEAAPSAPDDGGVFCGSGSGANYCGYHDTMLLKSGKRVFYAQSGALPEDCIPGCAPGDNLTLSPNGDLAVDGMITTLAHELTETITDPYASISNQRAWNDAKGNEDAQQQPATTAANQISTMLPIILLASLATGLIYGVINVARSRDAPLPAAVQKSTTGRVAAAINSKAEAGGDEQGPIIYQQGALVLTSPVSIYPIFYGKWSNNQISIVTDFFEGISSSHW
eukprot:jgi/Hompol1/1968/HPOL_005801-RA